VSDLDGVALPSDLSALDLLLHRGEANPRTRSGVLSVEILETVPEWEHFRNGLDRASRQVLRMRQKVVVPSLPTAPARWVVDPDFDLNFHVRRVRAPEPGTLREVLDFADVILQSPLDISRPLWAITLIEGMADGRAAVLSHMSHAVADGVGGLEMFSHMYDLEPEPRRRSAPAVPIPEDISGNDLMREGIRRLPGVVLGGAQIALTRVLRATEHVAREPVSALTGAIDYVRSAARVMAPAAEPSPLLRRRSLSTRSESIDIRLADMHAAAKGAGGSINDVYLASLCGTLRRYHEVLAMPVETLPMAVPVSLRAEADPAGGNHFAGVTLAAPVGESDPLLRIKDIREQMTERKEEPALDVMGNLAPVLSILPQPLIEAMAQAIVPSDVQASNVLGYAQDTYIAGSKIVRQYGLGPLPGVAMMVVLVSRAGFCTVTVRYDRASVTEPDLFARCLQDGFDEVLALGGGSNRSRPASFSAAAVGSDRKPPMNRGDI
jgi:WS/DGAT/MGAT family acyltransferase